MKSTALIDGQGRKLADGMWQGSRCFVVGGGPSLRGFEFNLLTDEKTIAVNRSYEGVPNADILFSVDHRFYVWYKDKPSFQNFPGIKVWCDPSDRCEFGSGFKLPCAGSGALGRTLAEGLGYTNSGYAAMNLALILGANPIYLLGFDLRGEGDRQAWWHEPHPEIGGDAGYDYYVKFFEGMVDKIPDGTTIYNCSPRSRLRCFPILDPRDVEAELRGPSI